MSVQSLTELDGPIYEGPPIGLPPDDSFIYNFEAANVPEAWHQFDWIKEKLHPVATGKGIAVAVLDTGYNKHTYGPEPKAAKSFINGQNWTDPQSGHGTHCAGTILCRYAENGRTIGLAPDADLIVGKVLSNGGSGGSDGISMGIRWAADQGAKVISMSLGGGSSYTPTNQAIDYAWSKGCIVVAAAGNSGYNGANTIGWPAKYKNCMCVGAYQANGNIANFSSGGAELDVACPGQAIVSFRNDNQGWTTMSGTSMATPGFAGLCACLQEIRFKQGLPAFLSADDFRAYLTKVLVDAGAPGWDARFGLGKPDGSFLIEAILNDLVNSGT